MTETMCRVYRGPKHMAHATEMQQLTMNLGKRQFQVTELS